MVDKDAELERLRCENTDLNYQISMLLSMLCDCERFIKTQGLTELFERELEDRRLYGRTGDY